MKKIFALLLVLTSVLALVACGETTSDVTVSRLDVTTQPTKSNL